MQKPSEGSIKINAKGSKRLWTWQDQSLEEGVWIKSSQLKKIPARMTYSLNRTKLAFSNFKCFYRTQNRVLNYFFSPTTICGVNIEAQLPVFFFFFLLKDTGREFDWEWRFLDNHFYLEKSLGACAIFVTWSECRLLRGKNLQKFRPPAIFFFLNSEQQTLFDVSK